MTRVLVLGATGFLGVSVVAALPDRVDVIEGGHDLVDLEDPLAVQSLMACASPQVVIDVAAVNPGVGPRALMEAVNVEAARTIAECAAALGARMVHLSTDVVHDGTAAPYADDAPVTPLGEYGRSKADGEAAVLAACPTAVAIRSSLIWDHRRIDRSTQGFADRLADTGELRLWSDVLRQPVHAQDLAGLVTMLALEEPEVCGTVNAGGAQVLSRAEHGRRLLDWFGLADPAAVTEATGPEGVPKDLRLSCDVVAALGVRLRGVDEVLAPTR